METSPIEAAEQLLEDLRTAHHRDVIGAIAIGQRAESAAVIENLIRFHRGYADGASQDQGRLTRVALALLSEISALRDALSARRQHALPESQQERFTKEYLRAAAPRLWQRAEELREALER